MFKAPEWEDDVPKTHTSFLKKSQGKQKSFTESKIKASLNVSNNKLKQKNLNKSSKAKNKPSFTVNKLKQKNSTKYKAKESPSPKVRNWKENKPLNVKTKEFNNQSHEKKVGKKSRKRKLETKSVDVKSTKSIAPQIPETQNFDKILLNAKKKIIEVIENNDKDSQTHEKKVGKKSRKRKLETKSVDVNNKKTTKFIDPQIPEMQHFDAILLNAKQKKINEVIENDDTDSQSHENKVGKKSRKRKLESKLVNVNNRKSTKSTEQQLPETQNFDEILLNAKKKKFNEVIENDDEEHLLFTESKPKQNLSDNDNKDTCNENGVSNGHPVNAKKQRLKAMLDNQHTRNHINVDNKSNNLRQRMLERLKAAQFRYLNEKLYTSSGSEAQELFKKDPAAFETYHQGYQLQVKKWPVNPLDVIVKKIAKMPKSHLIADMGCGEAALSKRVPHTVRSFDLVASAPGVEACDMARTPLLAASMDVVVYCLALMGTDLTNYLVEANRVLKVGGHLLIAEVESRFDNVENFTREVQRLGFKLKQLNQENKVFYFMEFTKVQSAPVKKAKLPMIKLKPCVYKRR